VLDPPGTAQLLAPRPGASETEVVPAQPTPISRSNTLKSLRDRERDRDRDRDRHHDRERDRERDRDRDRDKDRPSLSVSPAKVGIGNPATTAATALGYLEQARGGLMHVGEKVVGGAVGAVGQWSGRGS